MLTEELLSRIRKRAFLPNTTEWDNTAILAEVNTAQRTQVVHAIVRAMGEFVTEILDVTPDSEGFVRLPKDAVASTARVVTWVNDIGSNTVDRVIIQNLVNVPAIATTGNGTLIGVVFTLSGKPYWDVNPQVGDTITYQIDPTSANQGIYTVTGVTSTTVTCTKTYEIGGAAASVVPTTEGAVTLSEPENFKSTYKTVPIYNESEPLNRIELADIHAVQSNGYAMGTPLAFTLEPDGIRMYGADASNGSVRVRYSRKPAPLMMWATTGQATAWTVATVTVSAGRNVATLTAYGGGTGNLPGGSSTYYDITDLSDPHRKLITAARSGNLTLDLGEAGTPASDNLAARVTVGSLVCAEGYTVCPQYGDEWHDILMLYTASALAGLRKDYTLEAKLRGEAEAAEKKLINLAQPRTKQNVKTISAWRGHSRRPGRFS